MPRSATLEQAGGLHRMTLRGHSGPVRRVVISPNGRDVITVSEDGTAQVCGGCKGMAEVWLRVEGSRRLHQQSPAMLCESPRAWV
eukprot:347723-Chlamydomonas_euryale.AAC.2